MNSWKNNNLLKKLRETVSENERVALYVGTYGKYNDGSLKGKWLYPADYDTIEDFYDACRKLHKGEEDAEIMFQDAENLPSSLYSESGLSEEAFEYAKAVEDSPYEKDAIDAYVELYGKWDERDFEDRYQGEFDSDTDFAWDYIDSLGGISEAVNKNYISSYFDYERFGKEISWDMDEEYDSQYLEIENDVERAENYISDVYGEVENMDDKTLESYFDILPYARDLMQDYSEENGYYFSSY